jgi:hypothetical protein
MMNRQSKSLTIVAVLLLLSEQIGSQAGFQMVTMMWMKSQLISTS